MLVNYFVVLIVLLLLSGLAIDAGMLEFWQIHMQNAADAAAQQAVYQFGRNDSAFVTEGKAQASANGFTDGVNGVNVKITQPPTSTIWVGDSWSVQATVSQSVPNIFMPLLGAARSTVAATAVGRVLPTCVWIMNPSNSTSNPSFWLASATLSGACGLYVNTASGPSVKVDGFATLANLRSRIVGPSSGNSSSGNIVPVPKFNAAQKNDPLAYVTSPSFSSCTSGDTGIRLSSYTGSVNPATYCGGLSISNSTVTLNPGLYTITGGLTISGSTIYGTSGVTLFFTAGGGSSYGTVSASNSAIYLKAATTASGGAVPGIVIFGDRNWVGHGSAGLSFSNTPVQCDGIWYVPNIGVSMWQSPLSFYSYNGLVVDNLYMYGSTSNMAVNYAPLGSYITGTPYHYEDGALVN
jgi:hypothetical protein